MIHLGDSPGDESGGESQGESGGADLNPVSEYAAKRLKMLFLNMLAPYKRRQMMPNTTERIQDSNAGAAS